MHLVCFSVVSSAFLKALRVNQDDQASEWQGKIEMTSELLAELKDKARPMGLALKTSNFVWARSKNLTSRRQHCRCCHHQLRDQFFAE